ncbi:hypothetical protein LOTGIDRAFT_231257 [Lottia gigantea]|uniref:SH2 domain-containing protein n=1 Tax=Lottia gigantea TaxID=225164 RepID=V4AYY3_LOTGI|nr:hypothetical protein LOTGIDRAFT_231257 [Lottia gigantea]ESO98931.1 hypothetical protein LOTGIDRAFT_231257 [Lottia gigantea]
MDHCQYKLYENAKLYMIQAFKILIKCAGLISQNTTNISNTDQNKAVKRSIILEVNRPDHDNFVRETSKVYRFLMECSNKLEIIDKDAENNTAIGDRGRDLFKVLRHKKLKQSEMPVEFDLHTITSEYTERRQEILQEFKQLYVGLSTNLKLLYSCIDNWKESHKKAYIKVGHQFNINILKDGCTEACKVILKMIGLLNKDHYQKMTSLPDTSDKPQLDKESALHEQIGKQLVKDFKELFERCFVVEVEPTDVQKVTGSSEKGSKKGKGKGKAGAKDEEVKSNKCGPEFNVSVSVLCGRGLECISAVMKQVKAKLYYEENQKLGGCVSGELNVPQVSVGKDGIAEFKKQKIINFERPGKNNKSEQVTSERYRIVFETDLSIQNPKITIELKTMSLPMAIITGSNQANSAHGALLWYCYNTDPYLLPSLPVSIPTEIFTDMIQACFKYLDGRLLREDEINFLLVKLFKQDNKQMQPVFRNEVKFEEFEGTHRSKEDKTIPFWRVIHGFVSRERTDQLLRNEPDGVFLLRFSESKVVGDGQNKNLTGAIVAAFSRGAGSKPILSSPLTVESYFKKYSLYAVLSGIQNEEKGRQLLKKLYGTQTTIKDFKALYHHSKHDKKDMATQNKSYPNWNEQTLLMLSKIELKDDEDDDDDDDDNDDNDEDEGDEGDDDSVSGEIKRKKPKIRHDSMNSIAYSPEILNNPIQQPETPTMDEMILPLNAVDNLLASNNQHSGPSTSMFCNSFTPIQSNAESEFENTMFLPDGTVTDGGAISSSGHLYQVSSPNNQTSLSSFPSPAHSFVIGTVHSGIPSPQFNYGATAWSTANTQHSNDSIPITAQELSADFMSLSGPENMSDL